MLSLRAEIVACLFAVSLLGLLAGWMMQRARAARHLRRVVGALEERHAEAEDDARRDVENLEERLQSLAGEIRTLASENRVLRERSSGDGEPHDRDGDIMRAESIERNRRQAETQERLQRIIREREREIAALRAGIAGRGPSGAVGYETDAGDATAVDGLDETVRLDPALLPASLSARAPEAPSGDIRSIDPSSSSAAVTGPSGADSSLDDTLESTMDVAFLDAEEATVALDEETLSLVRGIRRGEGGGA